MSWIPSTTLLLTQHIEGLHSLIHQHSAELQDATGSKARVFQGASRIALVDSYQRLVVGHESESFTRTRLAT